MRARAAACITLLGLVLAMALQVVAARAQQGASLEVEHDLTVDLDPRTRALRVDDDIVLRGAGPVEVALSSRYGVEHASLDGQFLDEAYADDEFRFYRLTLSGERAHRLRLRYGGQLAPFVQTDQRGVLQGLEPMAGEQGSYLPAGTGWYPQVDGTFMRYRLTLHLPAGQRGLVPGRQIEESESAGGYRARYEFLEPTEGIELMAGPYVVQSRAIELAGRRVRLRTWFHPEIADLADGYLDATARYVELYSTDLGAYPFDEFGVVSSPLPTGFGMPTLTYLGVDVLKLPFIRTTSLGHEVLHNWWGNGVYVDYASGNWAEGLTTFMADYAYKEAESAAAARAMRLDWLRDFAAIPAEQDMPLHAFTSRMHGTSQIVGYNKAAFVFFMLREEIGADAFYRGLRLFWERNRFRRAGWDDLRAAFEQSSGKDSSGFFRQWLERSGAPRVRIEQARLVGDALHITLAQGTPPFALSVPVDLRSGSESRRQVLRLTQSRQTFVLHSPKGTESVSLDPDLHAFRLLDTAELPPILRNAMLDPATQLHVASSDPAFREAAKVLAAALLDHSPSLVEDANARSPMLIVAPLDVVDVLLAKLGLALPAELHAAGTAKVWATTRAHGKTIVMIAARDAQAISALRRGLPHYGKQSWLVFDGARSVARGTWPVQAQRVTVTD